MTHTVGQVADLLDTSGSTVRRWAGEFADHLSPAANPGRGVARQFSDDDLRVLGYVASRTSAGVPVAEIARELPTAPLPSLADLTKTGVMTPDDTLLVGLAGVVASSQETSRQIAATLERLADNADVAGVLGELRDQVDDLRRRVERLEDASHRHREGFPYRAIYDTSE